MPRVSRGASETGSRWSLSYIYPCLEHRVPCCVWTIRFCYEQRHLNMWQWKKHSVCSHNHTTRTHFSPWMMNDMSTAHSVTINLLPHLWQTLLLIVYGSGQSVHWFLCRLWDTHTHTLSPGTTVISCHRDRWQQTELASDNSVSLKWVCAASLGSALTAASCLFYGFETTSFISTWTQSRLELYLNSCLLLIRRHMGIEIANII